MTISFYTDQQNNDTTIIREDLIGLSALVSGTAASPGFIPSFAGTATLQTNTATELGYQVLTTGSGTTASAGISGSTAGVSLVLATANEFYASMKVGVGFLSDGTTKYKGMMGLTSSPNGIGGTSGVAFWIDQTTPVNNWQIVVGAGTMTPVNTALHTTAINAGQLYHLEIYKAAGSDTIDFYIDGVHVHSFTTLASIPYGTPLGHTETLVKNAGASTVGLHFDWAEFIFRTPAGRNPSFLS